MNALFANVLPALLRTDLVLSATAIIVLLFLRVSKIDSPTTRRVVYFAVLFQGCLFVQVPLTIPVLALTPRVERPPANLESIQDGAKRRLPPASEPSRPVEENIDTEFNLSPLTASMATSERPYPWTKYLAILWIAGIAVILSRTIWSYVRFVHHGLPPECNAADEWAAEWELMQVEAGIRRAVPLYVTEQLGPMLCRFPSGYLLILPRVVWRKLNSNQRSAILRHELAHLQRNDVWKSLGVRLLAIPHWFNPLAWWLVKQFDQCAEWACDDAARKAAPDHLSDFARALLQLGNLSEKRLLVSAGARTHGLSFRIRRLLVSTRSEDTRMKRFAIATLVLGITLLSGLRFQLAAEERPTYAVIDGFITGDSVSLPEAVVVAEDSPSAVRSGRFAEITHTVTTGTRRNPDPIATVKEAVLSQPRNREAIVDIPYLFRYLWQHADNFQQARNHLTTSILNHNRKMRQQEDDIRKLGDRLKKVDRIDDDGQLLAELLEKDIAEKKAEFENQRKSAQAG